jgi:hypothetical protein
MIKKESKNLQVDMEAMVAQTPKLATMPRRRKYHYTKVQGPKISREKPEKFCRKLY